MTEQIEPKKKRGRPPWTEEQKEAVKATMAKKREEKAIEQRRAETKYQRSRRVKKGIKYREGIAGPWSPEMRASNKATWDKKRKAADDEKKALIAANPTKTKKELGIDSHWKPADGSDSGYNAHFLRYARVGIDLPPIDIRSSEQVAGRIEEYFDFCESAKISPNMIGLSNWLGVSRSTLEKWKKGDYTEMTPIIQRAVSIIEECLVSQVQSEPRTMVGGMFILKTTFHYKEQQDIVISAGRQNDAEMSADEIADRYLTDGRTVETSFADEAEQEE